MRKMAMDISAQIINPTIQMINQMVFHMKEKKDDLFLSVKSASRSICRATTPSPIQYAYSCSLLKTSETAKAIK